MTIAMDWVKQYLLYALLIGLVWGVIWVVPRFASRVTPPNDYGDIEGLDPYAGIALDTSVGLSQLQRGDPICFRLSEDDELDRCFGWVAALPGDEVAIRNGEVTVNGSGAPGAGGTVRMPDTPGVRIPADHLYVVSSGHQYDSVAHGPLPAIALRGRLGHLP